jgi:hypothetical protein
MGHADAERSWVVLVTDGTVVEFAPEVYFSRDMALDEGRRWAWLLSAEGSVEVVEPFDGRLIVGIRDVRIVEVQRPPRTDADLWVGCFWSRSGYPDPEALLLVGREDAEAWVKSPIGDLGPTSQSSTPWQVTATFVIRGEEAYAIAIRAKEICWPEHLMS